MDTTAAATGKAPITQVGFDRLAGTTRLYLDFLYRPETVTDFLGPRFDDAAALRKRAEEIDGRDYRRRELVAQIEELADEYQASETARAHLKLLERPDTLVVFAGQQTGLFTGPLYTVYKALAAERWAADLSETLGRPVVPCFWLSTDDHDFDEVDHLRVPHGQELRTIRYTPRPAPDGDPVGRLRVGPEIEPVIAELEAALPETDFTPDMFRALRECYAEGTRFAASFGRLWYRMFPRSGLVPVSPCHKGFKRLAESIFSRALTDDRELFALYRRSSGALAEHGYHQQVHKSDRQTFLFYQQFKRHSIHHDDGGHYIWEGAEPVSAEWLGRAIVDHPDYISPNVLLRPVVQNGLFPTIGVVLGPSETAYYAQIGGIHDHFGVPRPLILPRTSVTLLERSVAKRVAKHNILFEDLYRDPDAEVARVLRASFPHDLEEQFDRAGRRIAAAFEEIRPDVTGFDATLDKPVRAAAARAQREMDQVAQKAYAAHKRKQEETEAQIRRLTLQLFPRGVLQERSLNIVYYWSRYGPDLLEQLYEQLPAGARGHLLWEL